MGPYFSLTLMRFDTSPDILVHLLVYAFCRVLALCSMLGVGVTVPYRTVPSTGPRAPGAYVT